MANAFHLLGEDERQVIAVIEIGSMTGGLAIRGSETMRMYKNNLLIVLNDNDMAIDENVGGFESNTCRHHNQQDV